MKGTTPKEKRRQRSGLTGRWGTRDDGNRRGMNKPINQESNYLKEGGSGERGRAQKNGSWLESHSVGEEKNKG